MAGNILSLFPPASTYDTFIDIFGGAANVLLAVPDRRNLLKVYNDVDARLFNFFRVLRDPEKRKQLIEMLCLTLYSRQQFKECIEMSEPDDPVERAWRFYVLKNQTFSGNPKPTPGRWSYGLNGYSHQPQRWVNHIESLHGFGEKFRNVQIENLDYKDLISRYDSANCLIYADPPYMGSTRAKDTLYGYEMQDTNSHKDLAKTLNTADSMIALSGYDCPEYNEWYSTWEKHTFGVMCSMSSGRTKQRRTECIWLNPACISARQRCGQINLFG